MRELFRSCCRSQFGGRNLGMLNPELCWMKLEPHVAEPCMRRGHPPQRGFVRKQTPRDRPRQSPGHGPGGAER